MTVRGYPVVDDLPVKDRWDFGSFPYGLEPLVLPASALVEEVIPYPSLPDAEMDIIAVARDRLVALRSDATATVRLPEAESEHELCWFRWITGHQLSFVIWQSMAHTIAAAMAGETSMRESIRALREFVRGYNAMLLYTSSCSRDVYGEVIRPSMYRHHRAFSGAWAPDYRPVRDLFRGRRSPFLDHPAAAELNVEINLYHQIHDGVAAKLVAGRSLLQESAVHRQPHDQRLLHFFYDSYFLTARAPITRRDVVRQMVRRSVAVANDLAVNGLYPSAFESAGERPAELCSAEVAECEHSLHTILYQVLTHTAGLNVESGIPLRERDLDRSPRPSWAL